MRLSRENVFKHLTYHRVAYFYGLLVVLIMGPLLLPGFILTLDMTWVPEITIPMTVSNTYVMYVVLSAINLFVPSDILQKVVLSLVLWCIGYGVHRLVIRLYKDAFQKEMPVGAAFATGLFAVINPFTYERFMDGHWQVLIGYAALPWIAWRLILLIQRPTIANATWWALSLIVLTSAGSVHMIPMGVLVASAIAIGYLKQKLLTRRFVSLAVCTVAAVALVNLVWIIPNITEQGTIASKIESFDYRHNATFRTRGLGWVPPELNVLTLHGYWGEAEGRFLVAQRVNPLWLLLFTMIAGIALYGAMVALRRRSARRIVLPLGVMALCAWILSLGTYSKLFGWLNSILNDNVPYFAGYREPQKFAALLALVLALLFGIGIAQLLVRVGGTNNTKRAIIAAGLILPILYTPLIFFGTVGQLKTAYYPVEWQQANERFGREGGNFAVVFLPWNNYFYFDQAERTIASPATRFFTNARIIQSEEPNIGLLRSGQKTDAAKAVQLSLIDSSGTPETASVLAEYDVKYILLVKTAEWEQYEYIDAIGGFTKVEDTPSTVLYRNERYGK